MNITGLCENCNDFYRYATENDCQIHKALSLLCMLGNFSIFINYCPFQGYKDIPKGFMHYCTFSKPMLLCHKIKAINKIIQKHSKAIQYRIIGCKDKKNGKCAIDNKTRE